MGDIVRMWFSQVEKDILQFMWHSRDIVEHHDAGRTLDGMHGTEYLVYALLIKTVRILLLKYCLLELFKKLPVLKQVHV